MEEHRSLKLIRYKSKPTLNAFRLLNLFVGGTWAAAKTINGRRRYLTTGTVLIF